MSYIDQAFCIAIALSTWLTLAAWQMKERRPWQEYGYQQGKRAGLEEGETRLQQSLVQHQKSTALLRGKYQVKMLNQLLCMLRCCIAQVQQMTSMRQACCMLHPSAISCSHLLAEILDVHVQDAYSMLKSAVHVVVCY